MSKHVTSWQFPDPAKLAHYTKLVAEIRELSPHAEVPSASDAQCDLKAMAILQTLKSQRVAKPLSASQDDEIRARKIYNEFCERVAYAKTKGVIWTDPFPGSTGNCIGEIQAARSELEEAIRYMANTTPKERETDRKIAALAADIEGLKKENADLKIRVHTLEQEAHLA